METGIFRRGDQISLWLMLVILTGVLISRLLNQNMSGQIFYDFSHFILFGMGSGYFLAYCDWWCLLRTTFETLIFPGKEASPNHFCSIVHHNEGIRICFEKVLLETPKFQ